MARYSVVELSGTGANLLPGIMWPRAKPIDGRASLEIFITGTFTSVAISAAPNAGVTPIPITGATVTAPGSLMLEIAADEYYATRTGGSAATVYYRHVG